MLFSSYTGIFFFYTTHGCCLFRYSETRPPMLQTLDLLLFKEGLLTLDNIDEYLAACEQKAKEFDLGEMNLYVQNKLSNLPQ